MLRRRRARCRPRLSSLRPPRRSADPGLWSARHGLLESETDDRPAGDVTFIDSEPPLRAFRPPRVAPELSPSRPRFLLSTRSHPVPEPFSACAALAVFALPCRADEATADAGNPDPADRRAGGRPQAGPPLPAPARAQGDESRQSRSRITMKCFMEQQKFFFDKESFQRREKLLAMPLKELPARELQDYGGFALTPGRLGGPARQPRLADPAEAEDRRHLPAAPRRAGAPHPGQRPQGAIPGRGRPGPLRRRPPDRQDHVRHVAPPGRTPDAHRQPGGHRLSRTRPSAPWRRCWSSRGAPTSTGR